MNRLTRQLTRQITTWIALSAILLAVLGPSLSHCLMQLRGTNAQWVEMCSATGNKRVLVDAAGQILARADALGSNRDATSSQGQHCPLCASANDLTLLPPFKPGLGYQPGARLLQPPLFYQAPRRLFIWTPSQSRAPPQLS